MKIICSICFLFASCFVLAQQKGVDKNFHVYLLIGQSNMAGRGQLDAVSKEVHPQVLMLDQGNNWVPATDPVHYDKPAAAGVGPGISFAREMLGNDKKTKIGLIPCALGGSPIKVWEPGAVYLKEFHPYDDAIRRARLAMQQGVLKGIIWHQGESDNDSARATVYLDKLTTLINRLRTDLQQPDLPFVAGEIGYFNKVNHINAIIHQLPQRVPTTAVVSARDLTDKGDRLHFDAPSARELGKRYAAAIQELQRRNASKAALLASGKKKQAKQPVVVLTFDDAEISHYTIVAPLLKKYNFDATFFVCEMPRKSPADSVHYMKWPQIAALHQMGFEIGNHTGHHKNMTKLSREEMQQEVNYIEYKCREYGIPKPISFAYPGNRADSLSQVVLQEMGYRFARAGGSSYYDPVQDGRLVIPSYTMGSSEKLGARTWSALKSLQPGQILIFTIHGVPDIAHPDYTTSVAAFTEHLHYMKQHGLKVIAVRDLGKYIPADQKENPVTKPLKNTYE
ncbi:sialate O-acetylesterase [Botryobacter ruber]|uniref:sialate O-acetylesterase n=1 Tax=Botryobacter ruber TaxID=2171629 RepID=UPI0013E3BEE5|nr:sialate O-acetylesterase [Botryobacter ruber]